MKRSRLKKSVTGKKKRRMSIVKDMDWHLKHCGTFTAPVYYHYCPLCGEEIDE
jgi:hypothetical protein